MTEWHPLDSILFVVSGTRIHKKTLYILRITPHPRGCRTNAQSIVDPSSKKGLMLRHPSLTGEDYPAITTEGYPTFLSPNSRVGFILYHVISSFQ